MDFAILPKIELHLHLDCSLSYAVVKQLAPHITPALYKEKFIAPDKCLDLADYIARAQVAIDLMQTEEQLRAITLDLVHQLKADNVVYAEIRFAPLLHTQGDLNAQEVVAIVCDALAQAKQANDIEATLILCTLRHYTAAQGLQTIQLAEQFKDQGVGGFDLAADEANFPIDEHIAAFQYAKAKGMPATAHAGEAKGPQSVVESLNNFHVHRIGHGVRSIEDAETVKMLLDKEVLLEVCPTSNIQTNIFDTYKDHSVQDLFQQGVKICINTDGRTISNTTLAQEYQHLHQAFNWGLKEFKATNLAAIDYAFTTEIVKNKLRQIIQKAYYTGG